VVTDNAFATLALQAGQGRKRIRLKEPGDGLFGAGSRRWALGRQWREGLVAQWLEDFQEAGVHGVSLRRFCIQDDSGLLLPFVQGEGAAPHPKRGAAREGFGHAAPQNGMPRGTSVLVAPPTDFCSSTSGGPNARMGREVFRDFKEMRCEANPIRVILVSVYELKMGCVQATQVKRVS
jgi:hypothetical protein